MCVKQGRVRDEINFKGGMRNKIETLQRERDLLILTDGAWGLEIDGELRVKKNRKSQFTDVTQRTATITRRDRDKHSGCGGEGRGRGC